MYKPSFQDDKLSVNLQNSTIENHNIKQNSHNNKNKDKSVDEKNNETKLYKKLKKNNIIRKKINLNLLSQKLPKAKIKKRIDTVNKSNNITSISYLSTKQNSRNASEKVIKSISHSNNFMVTINTSKSKDIQTKEKKQNLKFSINKTCKNNIPIGKKSKKECELCHTLVDSYLYRIHYMSHPTRILKFLYLGNFTHATKIEELKKLGINYILNCASECYNINLPEDIKELHLMIRDYEDFELFDYFEKANQFINKCKSMGGKCLVHCKLGISRSAAFVTAYLIKYTKLGVDEAFNYIKNKRITIKPNDGFMRQLYLYEKISKKNNSEN
jgi:protein-tyrosine phosphatase